VEMFKGNALHPKHAKIIHERKSINSKRTRFPMVLLFLSFGFLSLRKRSKRLMEKPSL